MNEFFRKARRESITAQKPPKVFSFLSSFLPSFLSFITSFFSSPMSFLHKEYSKKWGIVFLLVLGLTIVFFPSSPIQQPHQPSASSDSTDSVQVSSPNSIDYTYQKKIESEIKLAVEQMVGEGNVYVLVRVGSSEIKEFETNRMIRSSSQSDQTKEGVQKNTEEKITEVKPMVTREANIEVPLIRQVRSPSIEGILIVVVDGHEAERVRVIREAISKAMSVPIHRISVIPMKRGDVVQ